MISAASLREASVVYYSPVSGGPIFSLELGEDGGGGNELKSFAHPVPIDGVRFSCSSDAADVCVIGTSIMTP